MTSKTFDDINLTLVDIPVVQCPVYHDNQDQRSIISLVAI